MKWLEPRAEDEMQVEGGIPGHVWAAWGRQMQTQSGLPDWGLGGRGGREYMRE